MQFFKWVFVMKDLFINRKLELEKLVNGLKSNNDFVLVAPRRFGKTALALRVLDIIRLDPEFIILDIDLMKYSGGGVRSVAECIIEKSLHALGIKGRLRKMWRDVNFKFSISVKYQELEIEPLLHLFRNSDDEWGLLEEALEFAENIAIKQKKQVIVFYDEFGELYSLGERIIKLFRSVIQRHKHVSYLFAGSQETVMNKIFLDKSGAFYRFGELIYLKELDKKDVYDYICTTYPETGLIQDHVNDITVVDSILNELRGHPYYTGQVVSYLEQNKSKYSAEGCYEFLFGELLRREEAYLELQISKIKSRTNALEIMRLLALGLNPYEELRGVKEQNIYAGLRYLVESGYLRKESRGIYVITDPLLEKYLVND